MTETEIWATHTSEPIGRMELAYMAVGMRDPNPVHIDDGYAQQSGFPRVIAHGTFALGYFAHVAASGRASAAIRRLSINLRAPVLVGQQITTTATVVQRHGNGLIDLALEATADDTVVATGHAVVDPIELDRLSK